MIDMRCGRTIGLTLCLCMAAADVAPAAYADVTDPPNARLQQFLRSYAHDPIEGDDKSTRFSAAALPGTDLMLVYLRGRSWCGSGGCTLLVLRPHRTTFQLLSEISISRPPITMLKSRHHGLPDIGVWVQGGGILPGYQAALPFNGKGYADNPTVRPARKVTGDSGPILIGDKTPTARLFD